MGVDVEFLEHFVEVVLDGVWIDEQLCVDFLVGMFGLCELGDC